MKQVPCIHIEHFVQDRCEEKLRGATGYGAVVAEEGPEEVARVHGVILLAARVDREEDRLAAEAPKAGPVKGVGVPGDVEEEVDIGADV